jgi:hypothetical protein
MDRLLERANTEGKSIRQVINEDPLYAAWDDHERATLAKALVVDMLTALVEAGATPAQIRQVLTGSDQ